MFKKLYYSGFTIIEMLLVIALIAILATAGISFYRQRTDEVKITKQVMQIQQILQAASAFYMQYHCWPGTQSCPAITVPFTTFLPVSSLNNPWGGINQYLPANNGTNLKKFAVTATNIPANAAAQIANRLPNAAYANGVLTAEIAIPSSQQPILPFLTKVIGTLHNFTNGQFTNPPISFTCPTNWKGGMIAFITGLHPYPSSEEEQWCSSGTMGENHFGVLYVMPSRISVIPNWQRAPLGTANCSPDSTIENRYNCSILLIATGRERTKKIAGVPACYKFSDVPYGTVDITYIGFCSPHTTNASTPLNIKSL